VTDETKQYGDTVWRLLGSNMEISSVDYHMETNNNCESLRINSQVFAGKITTLSSLLLQFNNCLRCLTKANRVDCQNFKMTK
jgi:hypothetical protein